MIFGELHFFQCQVTFDLVDAGGVLHHPNYLVLLERARIEALSQTGYSYFELWKDGYSLAVREHTSEYFKPLYMGEWVTILTWVAGVKGLRIEVIQRIVSKSTFNLSESSGFVKYDALQIPEKAILHQVRMTLVSISLSPLKAARFPEKLVKVLKLPE